MSFKKNLLIIPILLIIFMGLSVITTYASENHNDNYAQTTSEQNISGEDLISGRDLKTKTVKEIAEIYEIDPEVYAQKLSEILGYKIKENDSFQLLHDNYGLEPSVAKDTALALKTNSNFTPENIENKKSSQKKYDLVIIVIILSLLYLISGQLVKKSVITPRHHRKIWNWILFLSFIISGILGILLILKENFGLIIPLPFSIVYWHAEIGIIFIVSSALHILSRWKLLLR